MTFIPNIKQLVVFLLIWKVLSFVWVWSAPLWLAWQPAFTAQMTEYGDYLPGDVALWGNFDGIHYMGIAEAGYVLGEQPFFPLYPVTMAILNKMFGIGLLVSGLIISHVCFFASFYFVWQLVKIDVKKVSLYFWWWLLVIWLSFPTSFYYGAVYNDSLFFLLAVITLYLGRRRQWLLAGFFGGLATLARLNGIALVVFLGFEYLLGNQSLIKSWKFSNYWKEIKTQIFSAQLFKSQVLGILLVPAAFLGYLLYIQVTSGEFMVLFSSMKTWNQDQLTFPPVVIWRYLKIFATTPWKSIVYLVATLEFLAVAFYCSILLLLYRKIRVSYWILIATSILIPWLTGTFAGMPRYALHLYPFFLGLALWFEHKPLRLKILYILVSLFLQFVIMSLFSQGYFVT